MKDQPSSRCQLGVESMVRVHNDVPGVADDHFISYCDRVITAMDVPGLWWRQSIERGSNALDEEGNEVFGFGHQGCRLLIRIMLFQFQWSPGFWEPHSDNSGLCLRHSDESGLNAPDE